jgi:hypothetical protein
LPSCGKLEEKAAYIAEKSKTGPVLVFGPSQLTEQLIALGLEPIVVEEKAQIDSSLLRNLD